MRGYLRKRRAMRNLLAKQQICFKHFRRHNGWEECPCHCHEEYKEKVIDQ